MKSYIANQQKRILFILPLAILALTLACVSPTKLSTINLNQEELSKIVQTTANITSPDGWVFKLNSLEILDGFIRVNGDYTPMGSSPVSGSMDINLYVEEDHLKGKFEKVRFQGFAVADQPLKIVSDLIVQQIVSSVSEGKKEVKFESVHVEEGLIIIVLRYFP